jgi:hypothetical protein
MSYRPILRILVKGVILFNLFLLLFSFSNPLPALGRISIYNHLVPGRLRLPYADDPQRAYSLSLFNLDAMFASHQLAAGPKPADEFRVLLIGDSATWGFLLKPEDTLSAQMNTLGATLPDGRRLRVYNLGYPVMSLSKDLLLLSYAVRYQPDWIVWLVTLESFPYDKQLFPPLVQHNPDPMRDLIQRFGLRLDPGDPGFVRPTLIDRTLIGQRRPLADLLRLQLYGVMWAATGIDQDIPASYPQRMEDLPDDPGFHDLHPPLEQDDLALDVLEAGIALAGDTPVLIVNEPMFVSHGAHSDIRYNFFYPRWAYDDYRRLVAEQSARQGWRYLDFWDAIPPDQFTNSAIHMTPAGTRMFATLLTRALIDVSAHDK